MHTYAILLRGINVGGKNKIQMSKLKAFLEDLGCADVQTYIQSGNVIVRSKLGASKLAKSIEQELVKKFKLDSELIRILVLTHEQMKQVVKERPKGFGSKPNTYHSDAIFLMDIKAKDAMEVFSPREGVDKVWPGAGVVYSQRLSAERTKSRLNKIIGTELYKSMTIRNWNTTTKLLAMMDAMEAAMSKGK